MFRFDSPYMQWVKTRRSARFDLTGSNILPCSIDDLPGARDALTLAGRNDSGYAPLVDAIAARYQVPANHVTTAHGATGANFLVCAALLQPGDEVLAERPAYDPLLFAAHLLGARPVRFERELAGGFALDPERVRRALTPRTRLIVITSPHNPSGVTTDAAALDEVGRLAEASGAYVLVDEVYLDAAVASGVSRAVPDIAARRGDVFISTSSLTKSYGLGGLRCGWALSSPAVAVRLQKARDITDGQGSIVTDRLGTLAFAHLDRLIARSQALLDPNGTLVREFLRSREEIEWTDPGGGAIVFPRVRGVSDASVLAERLLEERETAVVPGRFFEAPEHFRIGFGGATDALRGGLAALGAALDARAW